MEKKHELSAKVLEQLSILQNEIIQYSDLRESLEVACDGLKIIPGTRKIEYKLTPNFKEEIQKNKHLFNIERGSHLFAQLYISIEDIENFRLYVPSIKNFCKILALVFDAQNQKEQSNLLFDKGHEGFAIIKNRKFIDCNKTVLNLLNLKTKQEFLDHHPSELSPKYQPDGILSYNKAEKYMNKVEKKGFHRFEWVHRSRNRGDFLVEITLLSYPQKDDSLIYSFWRDISERNQLRRKIEEQYNEILTQNEEIKSANEELRALNDKQAETEKELRKHKKYIEKELKKSKTLFQAFMDNLPVCAYIKNERLEHVFLNEFATNFFTIPEQTSSKDLFSSEITSLLENADRDILAGKESQTLEYDFNLGGRKIWFRDIKFPIRISETETLLGGIALNITDQKITEERLNYAQKIGKSGHWFWDYDSNIMSCSNEVFRIIGHQPNEIKLSFKILLGYIHPADREQVEKKYTKHLQDKNSYSATYRIVINNGSIKYLNDQVETIFDNKGNPISSFGIITDITDRITYELELKSERDFTKSVIDSLPGPFYVYQVKSGKIRLIRWNKYFAKMSGYSSKQLENIDAEEIFSNFNEDKERIDKAIDRIFEQGNMQIEAIYNNNLSNKKYHHFYSATLYKTEEEVFIVGIGIDIADKKKTEQELLQTQILIAANEKKYRSIFDDSPVGICHFDKNGVITDSNKKFSSIFGAAKENLLGFKLLENLKNKKLENEIRKSLTIGTGYFEDVYEPITGTKNPYVKISLKGLTNSEKEIIGGVAIVEDISEVKKAEIRLIENQVQLQEIFDSSPAIMLLLNKRLEIVKINQAGFDRYITEKEYVFKGEIGDILNCVNSIEKGRTCGQHDNCNSCVIRNALEQTLKTKEPVLKKEALIRTDLNGTESDVYVLVSTKSFQQSEKDFILLTIDDITDRKKAELELFKAQQKLVKSEKKFRNIYKNSPVGIFDFNSKGVITECNDKFITILGSTRDKLVGLNTLNLPNKKMANEFKNCLSKGYGYYEDIYTSFTGNKTTFIKVILTAEYNNSKNIIGGFAIVEDISKRKKAEEALKKEKEFSEKTINSLPGYFFLYKYKDGNYNLIRWNNNHEKLLGYNHDEISNGKMKKFIPRHEFSKFEKALTGIKTNGFVLTEFQLIKKDGTLTPINSFNAYNFEEDGERYILGTGYDISERVKAEKELEKEKQKLQSIFRAAPTGIGMIRNRVLTSVNPQVCKMVGYSESELLFQNSRILYPSEEVYLNTNKHKYKQITKQGTGSVETKWRTKDGDIIDVYLASTPLDLYNINEGVTFIALDITKRKKAEKELSISNDRFNKIVNATGAIIWEFDWNLNRFTYISGPVEKVTGFTKNDWLQEGFWIKQLYSEDKEFALNYCTTETGKGIDHVFVYRFVHKNGKVVWFRDFVHVISPKKGEMKASGMMIDITKQKEAEIELKKYKTHLEDLVGKRTTELQNVLNEQKIILDNIGLGVILLKDGKVTWSNQEFAKMTGFGKSGVPSGTNVNVVYKNEKDYQNFGEKIYKTLAKGETSVNERILYRKDRSTFWCRLTGNAVDSNELSKGSIWIFDDITKEKEAAEALNQNLQYLQSLLSNLPAILWGTDSKGIFTISEGKELEKLGLKAGQVVGLSVLEVYKDYPVIVENIKKALEGKYVRYDSEVAGFSYEVIIAPQYNSNNKLTGIIGVSINMTERKKVEEALQVAKEQAEAANKAKSEFLANMSHEIRTPMNAILGFSQILRERCQTCMSNHQYIYGIHTSGKNLLRLIDDILDLSKVEVGSLEILYEPVNPYSLLKEIQQIFNFRVKEKGLNLNVAIPKDSPSVVLLDETRLRQVLFNLVGNAVKFTKEGSITVSIKSTTNKEKSSIDLTFEVADTGIGIPKDQQKIIFEAFKQRKGQKAKQFHGTGLGLAISKKLVEMMNGTISVESDEGKGATFSVFLPEIKIASIALEDVYSKKEIFLPEIIFEKAKILYVEDILSNRQVLKAYLESYVLDIYEAVNGEEALSMIKKTTFDLLIMDIEMPVMDGFKASRLIRKLPEYKNTPIIALTASAMKSDEEIILNYCDEYLKKPVSKYELVTVLAKYLPHKILNNKKTENLAVPKSTQNVFMGLKEFLDKGSDDTINKLVNQTKQLYEEIKETYSMDESEEFASILIRFGKEQNEFIISEFGKQLLLAIENFNFDKIEEMIDAISILFE